MSSQPICRYISKESQDFSNFSKKWEENLFIEINKTLNDKTCFYIKCKNFEECHQLWTQISLYCAFNLANHQNRKDNISKLNILLEISLFQYLVEKYPSFKDAFANFLEEKRDDITKSIDNMMLRIPGFTFEFTQLYNMMSDPNLNQGNYNKSPHFSEIDIIASYFENKIFTKFKKVHGNKNYGAKNKYDMLHTILFDLKLSNFVFVREETIIKALKTISDGYSKDSHLIDIENGLPFPSLIAGENSSTLKGYYSNNINVVNKTNNLNFFQESLMFDGTSFTVTDSIILEKINKFAFLANLINDVYIIHLITDEKSQQAIKDMFKTAKEIAPYLRQFALREFLASFSDSETEYLKRLFPDMGTFDYLPNQKYPEDNQEITQEKEHQPKNISDLLTSQTATNKYNNQVVNHIISRSHFDPTITTPRMRKHPENTYVKNIKHEWPLYEDQKVPLSILNYTTSSSGIKAKIQDNFDLRMVKSFISSSIKVSNSLDTDFVRYVPFLSVDTCTNIVRNFMHSPRFNIYTELSLLAEKDETLEESIYKFPKIVYEKEKVIEKNALNWIKIYNVCETALTAPIADFIHSDATSNNSNATSNNSDTNDLDLSRLVRYARLVLASIHRVQECKYKNNNPKAALNGHVQYGEMYWFYGGDYTKDPVDVYDESGEKECIQLSHSNNLLISDKDKIDYESYFTAFGHAEVIIGSSPLFAVNAWHLCQEYPVLTRITCGMVQRSHAFIKGLASLFLINKKDFEKRQFASTAFLEEYFYSIELIKKILVIKQTFDTTEEYVEEIDQSLSAYYRYIRQKNLK